MKNAILAQVTVENASQPVVTAFVMEPRIVTLAHKIVASVLQLLRQ
jgi:hypothetical protein